MSVLETRGLTKDYPGVRALDHFDIELIDGEVHGLVGENGAGKTTLVKLLTGVEAPTCGTILMDGEPVHFRSPRDALGKVGVVHQERELIGHFDAPSNLFLGEEPVRGPFIDRRLMKEKTLELFRRWDVHIPMDRPVCDLGSGQQELLMILKVLLLRPKLIILDEPTAALSADECVILFRLIAELRRQKVTIVYITHNLPEITELCDRVTVLAHGQKIATVSCGVTEDELISLMAGRDIGRLHDREPNPPGEPLFEAQDYACDSERLHETTFTIRRGEIVGFAGLAGSGRSALAKSIFRGARHAGSLRLRGKTFQPKSPADSISQGVVFVPQDRRGEGIVSGLTVGQNLRLPALSSLLSRFGFINFSRAAERSRQIVGSYGIKVTGLAQPIETLSGGNQQKVSVGKWNGIDADLWIFDEPTQGIDPAARREIYHIMEGIARKGAGLWLISSELRELTSLSDRICVMRGRRVAAEFMPPYDHEEILRAMMISDQNGQEA